MQLAMVKRQIDTLADDLKEVSALIEQDWQKAKELEEENKKRKDRGVPTGPVAMPYRSGWVYEKLKFINTRLQATIDYMVNQNVG